jgi:flagellar protein FlaG
MDVSTSRLPEKTDIATTPRFVRTPPPEAVPGSSREPADHTDLPGPSSRWTPPSTLKFDLTAADFTARFEIHEGTSRVTVTMIDRNTGEVLREVPSRRVLDQIAALESSGLSVDEKS